MKRSLLLLPIAVLVVSCKPAMVPIGDLAAHPERYDHKPVAVVGRVKGQVGVSHYAAYELADSTGTVTVASQTASYPLTGIRLAVSGEFHAKMSFEEGARPALLEARRWNPDKTPMVRPEEPESTGTDTSQAR